MRTIKKFLLKLLIAAVFVLPMTGYAACGSNDKKITFTDGATACLNEFNLLNIKGLMKPFPNESYTSISQSKRTYAVAVSADPLLCPFEHSMQWDWNGDDGRRAINACESRMPATIQAYGKSESVQNCKCEVLIDNGRSNFTRSAFEQKTKLYEIQIALGFKPIQVAENQIKEQVERDTEAKRIAEREAEIKRQAETKKREDEMVAARKEKEKEEAKRIAEREAEIKRQAETKKREDEMVAARKEKEKEEAKRIAEREAEIKRQAETKKREDEMVAARKEKEEADRNRIPQAPTQPVNSQVISATERRVALVIGNSAYKVSPLDNPTNDATDITNALNKVGFDTTLIRNATLGQIREATRKFADQIRSADVALIYFAGHGIESNRKNYMIPVNADLKFEYELADQAYDSSNWLEMLETIRSSNAERVNIVILDACRNNNLIGARSLGRGLGRMDAPTGTFLAYSTAPGKVAADGAKGQRNSPYTRNLLSVMQKPGLPIEETFKEVRRNVSRETNGAQVPWESTSLIGGFYFTTKR